MNDSFTLKDIAEWQLSPEKSIVKLPPIQRGFVWKPKQIEDLWDSLLRGYPVGSFLFSRIGENFDLMDGQQRATSIFLGYFNPFNPLAQTKAWAIKGELPVVWIDVKPDTKPFASKYLIRLTTRSHPWGYQANSNDSKLSVSDRRDALELFKKNNRENEDRYTSFKNSTVFPYDACYPLPLCFFIESKNIEELIEQAEQYLPSSFSTKRKKFVDKNEFLNLLKHDLRKDIDEIFSSIREVERLSIKANIIEDKVLHEENESDNPTLFIRINSSGTALTGDDLIYSIYKAIFPEAKDLIEDIGMRFIAPPQILSLVSRLVASGFENNIFIKKFNVRDFERRIKNDEFKERLQSLIKAGTTKRLFEQAIQILSCKNNSLLEGEIPPVIIKHFIKRNPDLFLFFIHWLHVHTPEIDEKTQLKMVSKLLTFVWFEFSNISLLWSDNKLGNRYFWDKPLTELSRLNEEDGIGILLRPELLKRYYSQNQVAQLFKDRKEDRWNLLQEGAGHEILHYLSILKSQHLEPAKASEYFTEFIRKIQHNRQLILFAQREYINSTFGDFNQMDEIDDTNVPWDWDHIYPDAWVYKKWNCHQSIRDWNNTNGNFRTLSLENNRSRGCTQAPNKIDKFEEKEQSFIQDIDWQHWKKISGRISGDEVENHFRAITTRMINIYEKFWNDLKVDELISDDKR